MMPIARRIIAAFLLLVVPSLAVAQQSVVEKYRPLYPTPLGADKTVALLRQVAAEVGGGLLKKPDGANCLGYACDIVCFDNTRLIDVLQDAEGLARPAWRETTNPRGYVCEQVAPGPHQPPPAATPPPPPPTPTPTPTPTGDLAALLAEQQRTNELLAALLAEQVLQRNSLAAAVQALQATVAAGVKVRF